MDHESETYRTDLMTITRFVLNEQSKYPESRGDFTILLSHIVLGCKFVCSAVSKAGLAKLIGLAGDTNVQGEEQKKLDVLSITSAFFLDFAAGTELSSSRAVGFFRPIYVRLQSLHTINRLHQSE